MKAHWAEVQGKQRLAAELRKELRRLQEEGVLRQAQSNSGQLQPCWCVYRSAEYRVHKETVDEANRQLQGDRNQQYAAQLQLSEAEAAPEALPSGRRAAGGWRGVRGPGRRCRCAGPGGRPLVGPGVRHAELPACCGGFSGGSGKGEYLQPVDGVLVLSGKHS